MTDAAESDLAGTVDQELVVDLLIGPLYYRRPLGHAEVDPQVAEQVLDLVLAGIAASQS